MDKQGEELRGEYGDCSDFCRTKPNLEIKNGSRWKELSQCDGIFPDLESTKRLMVEEKSRLGYYDIRQLTVRSFEQQ